MPVQKDIRTAVRNNGGGTSTIASFGKILSPNGKVNLLR